MNKNQKEALADLEAPDGLPDWCYEKYLATELDEVPAYCFFKLMPQFFLFNEHYKNCLMMLELKKGDCPDWVIKYIAAFELAVNDQEQPKWMKDLIFPSYLSSIGMEYSQPLSSEIAD